MAIAEMKKVIVAAHNSDADQLLEMIQQEGIMEVLDAERGMVSKEWPELQVEAQRPKGLEATVARLEKSIAFLKANATEKDPATMFQPLVEVEMDRYREVIESEKTIALLEDAEANEAKIEQLRTQIENNRGVLKSLMPWESLTTKVEDVGKFENVTCFAGMLPHQHFDDTCEKLAEYGSAVEKVSADGNIYACLIACMNEDAVEVGKVLRGGDFDAMSFDGMNGTAAELIADYKAKVAELGNELDREQKRSAELAENRLDLQILFDHYFNMLDKEQTRAVVPATEQTVLLEGWVKTADFEKLQTVLKKFKSTSISEIEPAEDEEVPIDIDNNKAVKPFELITRLYGMPNKLDVDPTACLAPFFALFFGLCLTDAAYGLIMLGILWWMYKKMQGNKGFLWMFITCAVVTVFAGAMTGSWCGDAIQVLLGEGNFLDKIRVKIMWFDPMKDPMKFFILALGLGYIQILFGLGVGFVNHLKNKDYMSAFCEKFSWLIFLNSLLIFGLSKAAMLPTGLAKPFSLIAIAMAVVIFLFTERNSGIAGRIGGGVFGLFSTVFFFGDVLSYVRLMALGMVTAGLGMAINILVVLVKDTPYVGFILGAVLFVAGHLFNLAMSTLSSFVHSLRLQFVEFFPKFLIGGGKDFVPLQKKYTHVLIKR